MCRTLPKEISRLLDEADVSYEIRGGTNHHKLYINGRMVTVLCREWKKTKRRTMQTCLRRIKRALNETKSLSPELQ